MSNREIKFRAWLVDHEQMIFANNQASTDCNEIWVFSENNIKIQVQETIWREGGGETFERIEYVDTNAHIMQYTGLKDRNGVEIYEGDILGGYPHGTVQVKWSDEWGCFESFSIENTFNDDGEPIEHEIGSLFVNDLKDCFNEWSVIGNIHQTPELL